MQCNFDVIAIYDYIINEYSNKFIPLLCLLHQQRNFVFIRPFALLLHVMTPKVKHDIIHCLLISVMNSANMSSLTNVFKYVMHVCSCFNGVGYLCWRY